MRAAPADADDTGSEEHQGVGEAGTADEDMLQADAGAAGGGGGRMPRDVVTKGRISPSSRYFGGNPAVQWLVASVCVLAVMGVVGVVVQRRIGGGKIYVSVPSAV